MFDDSGFDFSTDEIDVLEASSLIQALPTTETVERPVTGMKRPRTNVLELPGTSTAKKCPEDSKLHQNALNVATCSLKIKSSKKQMPC